MGLKLRNNATSTLAAAISETTTTLQILGGHGARFPIIGEGDWFPVALQDVWGNIEYVKCTVRNGDAMAVERAQEGTQARAFAQGSLVFVSLTVAAIAALEIGSSPLAVSINSTVVSP